MFNEHSRQVHLQIISQILNYIQDNSMAAFPNVTFRVVLVFLFECCAAMFARYSSLCCYNATTEFLNF